MVECMSSHKKSAMSKFYKKGQQSFVIYLNLNLFKEIFTSSLTINQKKYKTVTNHKNIFTHHQLNIKNKVKIL